jgi:hypothetical protein
MDYTDETVLNDAVYVYKYAKYRILSHDQEYLNYIQHLFIYDREKCHEVCSEYKKLHPKTPYKYNEFIMNLCAFDCIPLVRYLHENIMNIKFNIICAGAIIHENVPMFRWMFETYRPNNKTVILTALQCIDVKTIVEIIKIITDNRIHCVELTLDDYYPLFIKIVKTDETCLRYIWTWFPIGIWADPAVMLVLSECSYETKEWFNYMMYNHAN